MTLFRYRPLSELLFKELFYQEIYFATYPEINDPLDLTTKIDFSLVNQKQLSSLSHFIFKSLGINFLQKEDYVNSKRVINFMKEEDVFSKFNLKFFGELMKAQKELEFASVSDILDVLLPLEKDFALTFKIDSTHIASEIDRLNKKFFRQSNVSCFSEVNDNFLMWSHYATKHSGICLEFNLDYTSENVSDFQFEVEMRSDQSGFFEKINYHDKIHKVRYEAKPVTANFFDFLPIIINEDDADVIGLGKSYWHPFAHRIQQMFCVKALPWQYEHEWRIVSINFEEYLTPEKRIRNYPLAALRAIYFGMRTPLDTRNRIYNLYKSKFADLQFYEAQISNRGTIEFKKWVFESDY